MTIASHLLKCGACSWSPFIGWKTACYHLRHYQHIPYCLSIGQLPSTFVRVFSSSHQSVTDDSLNSNYKFTKIYKFRYIMPVVLISRFKVLQTALLVGMIPVAINSYLSGTMSIIALTCFTSCGVFATGMLYVMSYFFRHIIGIISVNQNEDVVRLSHLTFWGRRHDVYSSVEEIVPLSDTVTKQTDIYHIVQFYNKPLKFFWFYNNGIDVDDEAIEKLLGKWYA